MESYSTTLTLSYGLAISIELAYKVSRPNKKDYLVPIKVYHLVCNLASVVLGAINISQGETYWAEESGCDFIAK
jgi:hypothetical protein